MFLSPNHRLAILATRQYRQAVYPFQVWIESLWQSLQASEAAGSKNSDPTFFKFKLLTALEQITLFEEILEKASTEYPLLRKEATAKMLSKAWDLCQAFDISLEDLQGQAQTEDQLAYLQWAKAYQTECQTKNCLDSSSLLNYLCLALEKDLLVLPDKITCLGFGEWTSQQQRFLKLCEQKGTKIEIHSLLKETMLEVSRLGFASEEAELRVALESAKAYLDKNPQSRIGVIIPDLEQKRFAVLRILEKLCNPQTYNVAAPIPADQYPILDSAFLGLSILPGEIPFEQLSKLLRLSYLGSIPEELCEAAELEVHLRASARTQHSLAEYIFFMESIQEKYPKLKKCSMVLKLKSALALRARFFGKQSAQDWKDLCAELLNCLGWPGTRALNEEEQTLKKLWDEAWQEYCALDPILGPHSYADAIKHIRRSLSNKPFLAKSHQTSIDAPIQVLGLLEGLGFPFDYLWVTGMHRDAWPMEPAPNPFIPLSLQIAHQLPRSSAARELFVAERITQELASGASKVIFSYPKQILQQATTFSPLIAEFKEESQPSIVVAAQHSYDCNDANKEHSTNSKNDKLYGPALTEQELTENKGWGGSNLLKLQATCPFRAFAEIRLKAPVLKKPSLGLSAAKRGDILHQVLGVFWKPFKNQAALLALTENERNHCIQQAITLVFESEQKKFHSNSEFSESYLSLERDRIFDLIKRFLLLEMKRPPFEILAHELPQEIVLGGMRLKLRIDRIDQLENGDELLIDYKTGLVQLSEWFGERPLSPQLPLYCIARKKKTEALAFAIIRPDELRYRGLGASKQITEMIDIDTLDKMKRYGAEETWDAQMDVWEKNLETLAQEFKAGDASIDPIKGEQSCRNCHLRSLCRRNY